MKRSRLSKKTLFIWITLCMLVMCGCNSNHNWAGYQGTMQDYEYYYEDGRERKWEEDILSFAENYISCHPYLIKGNVVVEGIKDDSKEMSLFDEEKYNAFVNGTNELIKKIPQLSDIEVTYELQRLVALLRDTHSNVLLDMELFFPFSVESFYVDGQRELRVVVTPKENKDLIFSRLVSINGVPIEEIMERITPYISSENEYNTLFTLISWGGGEWLSQRNILAHVGVMEWDATTAEYEFLLENGETRIVEVEAITSEEWQNFEIENRNIYKTYDFLYRDYGSKNYWYEVIPESNAIYFRIASFHDDIETEFVDISKEVDEYISTSDTVDKIIVDLRGNYGGTDLFGYKGYFLSALQKAEKVYILIDSSSLSYAVRAAYELSNEVESAMLVGTPTGEGSTLIGLYRQPSTTENYHVNYYVAYQAIYLDWEKEFDTLMPDILIYPTLEDYKNGVDTILEAVLEM